LALGYNLTFDEIMGAAELVRLKVDVLLMVITPAALAAKDATTTIPIVMAGVGDPVGSGLVASLARPGGNVTGLAAMSPELTGKQLEFIKAVLPTVSRVAILWNPANPANALQVQAADVAAAKLTGRGGGRLGVDHVHGR
jgi:putative tryptophan/tyrosine transport system substrate-binding protein